MPATVAVNGRFLGMPITGVQRYGYELVRRLPAALGAEVSVYRPGAATHRLRAGEELPTTTDPAHGARGHLWEQTVLPLHVRRGGHPLLFSPCNWGPLASDRHVVFIHDAGPLLHPELFEPDYVRWARLVLRPLARRARGVVTSCERTRAELCAHLPVDPARTWVVPPGVAPTFATAPQRTPGQHCVFVGGRDRRKNLQFLLSFWPQVHAELGLELRVVARAGTTTRQEDRIELGPGVSVVPDPPDEELAELYAGALCLLWPSRYEGYGLPLLEAMATGTPFLSADTGAAAELAPRPDLIQPLDAHRWRVRLAELAGSDTTPLRAKCRKLARLATWDAAAARLAAALGLAQAPRTD